MDAVQLQYWRQQRLLGMWALMFHIPQMRSVKSTFLGDA